MLRPVSDEATTEALTQEQAVAGTLPYMSPEELRGERADHRSDLYSFGVVLYEMATGRRPFDEKISTALANAIINKPPEPPSSHNRKVSPGLEVTITKALDKDPGRRYQSARDMQVDLERLVTPVSTPVPVRKKSASRWMWSAAAVAVIAVSVAVALLVLSGEKSPEIDSIAVLPLENLSGDPEQEYFVDGMTEELIAELSKIGALRVISRQSVMRFKGTDTPLPEIAKTLNVDALIEGSVRRSGDRVRITAQLIQASPEQHLWAESYERDLRDVLTLQGEIAVAVAQEVRANVMPEEVLRLANARPLNPKAHEAYLKGRYQWNQRTEEAANRALEHFRQAIEIEPGFAAAHAGIADCYGMLVSYGFLTPDLGSRSRAAATKALEIDENCVEARTWLATMKGQWDWDWSGAEREHRQIVEQYPSYAPNLHWYATMLAAMGRSDEAIEREREALSLDPLSPIINAGVGLAYHMARRYDKAIGQAQKTLELFPGFWGGYWILGIAYEQQSRTEEAISALEKARVSNDASLILGCLGHAYAVARRREQATIILDELHKRSQKSRRTAFEVALIHHGFGEAEKTFDWLERALPERAFQAMFINVDPRFDNLRHDPRFQDLVRRMGVPE
jgi:TolB-like protein/Flp pilus assembly protein TadD